MCGMVKKFVKREVFREYWGTRFDCVPYLVHVPDVSPFSWASGSKDKYMLMVLAACAILYMAGTTLSKREKKIVGIPPVLFEPQGPFCSSTAQKEVFSWDLSACATM